MQQQQKKVGEILKNNFLDSVQSTNIQTGSAPTGKHTVMNIGSSNTTSANPKSIKSFAIHEQQQ